MDFQNIILFTTVIKLRPVGLMDVLSDKDLSGLRPLRRTGVNILSCDPFGPSFQQKKIKSKSVHKQNS